MAHTSNGITLAITASLATNPSFFYSDKVAGRVGIPSGSSITTLTFYDSHDGVTFVLATDAATAGVLTVEAGKSYKIPYELVGAGLLKIVGNAAGDIYLNLKA
jgi:hypothetical protein